MDDHPLILEIFCERPVFIVGMPRSGTSLLEQILMMHSKVDTFIGDNLGDLQLMT